MAERITALGGTAEGTLQAVAGRSKLPVYPVDLTEGRAHLAELERSNATRSLLAATFAASRPTAAPNQKTA